MRRVVFTLLITGILAHGYAHRIYAQTVQVSLAPATQVVYAKPGTSVTIPISIVNAAEPTSFVFKPVYLITSGTRGALKPTNDFPTGISVSIPEKEAQFFGTRQQKKTTVTITIDSLVAEQDYYLGFMIRSVGKKHSEGKSSLELVLQPIATVLLTVTRTGTLQQSGFIDSFTIGKGSNVRFFDSTESIPVNLIAANSGNNWIHARGTITLVDMLGTSQMFQVPKQRILAHAKRLVRSTVTNSPDHSLTLSGLHVGKYIVTTQLAFEGTSALQTRTTTFVAFPFKLVALLTGLGIMAALVVSRLNRPVRVRQVPPQKL